MPKFYFYNNLKFIIHKNRFIKRKNFNCFLIMILSLLLIFILIYLIIFKKLIINIFKNVNLFEEYYNSNLNKTDIILDYKNNTFAIITCKRCKYCGLFAIFKYYLYEISILINEGYVPIIDLESFPNIFNGFNITSINENPWEIFFNQPLGYTLRNVKKKAKNIKFFECIFPHKMVNFNTFYRNYYLIEFWHNIAIKYIPVKNEIINEANDIKEDLFKGSNNILGILIRGTDYLTIKPRYHPIPPKSEVVFKDIKKMDKNNNYDYYFIVTEDNLSLLFV